MPGDVSGQDLHTLGGLQVYVQIWEDALSSWKLKPLVV